MKFAIYGISNADIGTVNGVNMNKFVVKRKGCSDVTLTRIISLRNTLFRFGLIIPTKHFGGDAKYVYDEIAFADMMEKKYVAKNCKR